MDFSEWLEECKCISHKSSHDVASRLKRSMSILGVDDIGTEDLNLLESKEEFRCLGMTVKSQLRRSVRLYSEYKMLNNHKK